MKFLLPLLTFFMVSSTFGQDSSKEVSADYVAHWKKDEKRIFYILRNKEEYEAGKLTSEFNFAYEAHVAILDSSSNGYSVEWTFQLPAKVIEGNPELAASLPVYNDMRMIFKTSVEGEFEELVNWKEVRDGYIKMMEFSLPKNMDSSAKAAVEQSKMLFNSKEMVENTLIKEIDIFYFPYGILFRKDEIKVPLQLPNPFGDTPLPGSATYKISDLSQQKDNFILTINRDIDKVESQKIFTEILKNTDQENTNMDYREMMAAYDVNEFSEYAFIPSIGWPKRIKYRKTIKSSSMTQTDSFIIEMKQ